jgi:hypothetical protein
MHARRGLVSLLTLSATLASLGLAQGKTTFGIQAGPIFSKFGGPDAKNVDIDFTKTRVGFAAGAFVELRISPSFAIQPEGMFVVKGGKAEATGATAKAKLSYVEVPLLAKFRIPAKGNGQQFSPHLYGGPFIAFKVDCSISGTDGTTTISGSCDDNDIHIKSTDFGVVFGVGVEVGRAMIDARYDLGLSKIVDESTDNDVKNRTLYLLVGWSFRSPR